MAFGRKEKERDTMGTPVTVFGQEDGSGAMLLMTKSVIGKEDVLKAADALKKYKEGKANLEARLIEGEKWFKLRHWEAMRKKDANQGPEPASAWLFNAIMNKHADAMDNYPVANVLPRERSDEESAKIIKEILPVIMERTGFEEVYSEKTSSNTFV